MKRAMAGELGKTPSPEGSENHTESILSMDSILKTVGNKEIFEGNTTIKLHFRIIYLATIWRNGLERSRLKPSRTNKRPEGKQDNMPYIASLVVNQSGQGTVPSVEGGKEEFYFK